MNIYVISILSIISFLGKRLPEWAAEVIQSQRGRRVCHLG